MRRSVAMMAAVSVFALVGVASAIGASGKLNAKASTYDPDKTGIIVSAWKSHAGLPDAGGSDHGLVLQKNGPTGANAAAGALITGVDGMVANGSNWGWDYKTGTYCGAGAPRFNVIT